MPWQILVVHFSLSNHLQQSQSTQNVRADLKACGCKAMGAVRMNVDLLPSPLRCKSARLPGVEGCVGLMADLDFTCFCRQGSGGHQVAQHHM